MLHISLNEAVYTVATGLLFLAGIISLLFIFHRDFFDRISPKLFKPSSNTPWLAMAIIVILGFLTGMTSEHVSDLIHDRLHFIPFSEPKLRVETLFKEDGTFTPLGRDLYNQGNLAKCNLNDSVDSLYYRAKNTVYQDPNYFAELSLIQTHIDFARSLTFLSILFSVLFLVFLLKAIWKTGHKWSERSTLPKRDPSCRNTGKQGIGKFGYGVFIACVGVGGLSYFSLVSEEKEFNKRVFGYYRTMQDNERSDVLKCSEVPQKLDVPLSGIIKWRDNYIVVSDEKGDSLPRLYYLEIRMRSQQLCPIVVKWRERKLKLENLGRQQPVEPLKIDRKNEMNIRKPTDIESICTTKDVVDGSNDIWILESGHYRDPVTGTKKVGRLIRLVESTRHYGQFDHDKDYDLPDDVDNIEGMHCWRHRDNNTLFFVVAERGGSSAAQLRIWKIEQNEIVQQGQRIVVDRLKDLAQMSLTGEVRWISGLTGQFIEEPKGEKQWLWATGAIEEGERLASVLYQIGTVVTTGDSVSVDVSPQLCRVMPKDKFEGITMGDNLDEFVIVADNEIDGGLATVVVGCSDFI